jgi:iron complex outermembrane receptor protein
VKEIINKYKALLLLVLLPNFAFAENCCMDDLFNSSIADLTNLKVSSVSKVSEESFHSPAAIYVITSEDIKRSGATILPEILRFAPGIEVAQISANKWAVSARGFTDQLSNKLLVLMDGRSVYSPDFSGVYWEIQDTLLEDIDRIEIIRGPGAALWGANAVNGVINIITKKAKDTQGTYLSQGIGTATQNITEGRFGGKTGDSVYYRSYAKYSNWDDLQNVGGGNAHDGWFMRRGGFKIDYEKSPQENITIQSDIYDGNENKGRVATYPTLTPPYSAGVTDAEGGDVGGGNIFARWNKNLEKDSDIQLQVYYDNARRDYIVQGVLVQTFDADFQHSFRLNSFNDIVWGLGARYMLERTDSSIYFNYMDDHKYYNIYNSFVQDKITLIEDKLFFTLGTKIEDNSFTNVEIQPSAKLAYNINNNQMAWASVSRAVRIPSRAEEDIQLVVGVSPTPPAGYASWQGNKDFDSEKLIAYELGYRVRKSKDLSLDFTAFYNDYSDLRTAEPDPSLATTPPTKILYPLTNEGYGESYGMEFSVNYDIERNWRLSANYSLFTMELHVNPGNSDPVLESMEGNSPHDRFNIRSMYNLGKNIEFDNSLYYVDNLSSRHIESYIRFDTRVAWRPIDYMEVSLIGQNLFDDEHPEFTGALFSSSEEVGRSLFGKVTWRY